MDINKLLRDLGGKEQEQEKKQLKIKEVLAEEKRQAEEKKQYNIYIQFDEDEPKLLYQNLKVGDPFRLELEGPGDDQFWRFIDLTSGKVFKLFAK